MHLNKVAGLLWHRCFPVNFVKFLRKTFLQKTSEQVLVQCPQHGGEAKKAQLFYIPSPSGCFWILRLFSFRNEEGRKAFEEEENEISQRFIEENSNNSAQNQKQVAVGSIASVVKNSTYPCCSGKSQISTKNSQQWQSRMDSQLNH